MKEEKWDKLLQIRTTGRDDSHADQYRYPYEPTPYPVLERLANSGYIRKGNTLLDYGCGKGRVDFFLSWQTRCRSIGIEYNERIYEKAVENQNMSSASGRVKVSGCRCGRISGTGKCGPDLFFQPVFSGNPAKSDQQDSGFVLRGAKRNFTVFLLPVR